MTERDERSLTFGQWVFGFVFFASVIILAVSSVVGLVSIIRGR